MFLPLRDLSAENISILISSLPYHALSLSLSLRLHIEIVYASDKKVLLILWFVREQTRAIGQLLFSVEFSLRGVCGLHDD